MTRFALALAALSAGFLAQAQDALTVQSVEGKAPEGVAEPLADLLSKTSYAIVEDGKEVLHVWLRDEIPSNGAEGEFVGSETIEDGTFVGVYEVKEESFTDFRGQDLKPGVYTLRMSSHPQDGNHMGIAATPQFLCLALAEEDKSPEPVDREELMEMSKRAARTGHPAALYAAPVFEAPKGPGATVHENDANHVLLDVSTKAALAGGKTAVLALSIVFIGESEGG
jgi:hypothetical protein